MKGKSGKNRNISTNISTAKKIISVLLAITLVLTGFPGTLFEGALPAVLTAFAANKDHVTKTYPDVYPDSSKTDFYKDGAYKIYKMEDLSKYSQAYYQYPENHETDTITLAYSSGTRMDKIPDFFGIGTQDHPFKGTIRISSGSDNVVNIPESFFDYVYDSVQIISDVAGSTGDVSGNDVSDGDVSDVALPELAISRITDNTGEPVLAKHVRHDTDYEGETVNWKVRIDSYYDGTDNWNYNNAGIIGEMEDGAKLILDITDNNGTATDIEATSVTGDVGRVCGKMGQNTELTVNSIKGTNTGYKITASNGNAGGIVGVMDAGAVLTLNCQMGNRSPSVTAAGSGKYAGGLVGQNNGGTVVLGSAYANTQYVVGGTVKGTAGSGGLFGYYRPVFTETSEGSGVYKYEFDISRYTVNVTGSGSGSIGGLFGVFENKRVVGGADAAGGTVNIIASESGHKTVTLSGSGSATDYGGLIGKYRAYALESVLNIGIEGKVVGVLVSRSGNYSNYGGGIGQIETSYDDAVHPAYVKFEEFTVTASGADLDGKFFGGVVGRTGNSFIDANGVKVTTSGNFEGGGVVGWLGDGVLRMTGSTDLSGAQAEVHTAYQNGQVVGCRDNALVFAEKDWLLSRSGADIDDIGSWGEVLRFDGATQITMNGIVTKAETLSGGVVLTVNETAHTVEIGAPTTEIGSVAEFAKTALCFQIDESGNSLISFASGAAYRWNTIREQNITLTDDIEDLPGTGLTGFTRDNAQADSIIADKCVYEGTFNGDGHKIVLAVGESKGVIYRHRYNGLFGILNGGTIQNVTFDGTCGISAAMDGIYAGAGAARATGNFTAQNVNVSTKFTTAGSGKLYMGRLLGEAESEIGNITVTNTADSAYGVFSGDITGNNSNNASCFGGVIGRISHSSTTDLMWKFKNIVLSGEISNTASKYTQQIGGLVAYIANTEDNTAAAKRKLDLDNVETKGLIVSGTTGADGTSQRTSGGLLGYAWYNTDVDVKEVTVSADDEENASKVELKNSVNGYGDLGGLVYSATGKWDVTKLKIDNIEVNASKAKSFGMIVNRGWYSPENSGDFFTSDSSSAIYLLLNNTSAYVINTADLTSLPANNLVFDELVAYSAYYREENGTRYATDNGGDPYVLKNGQGIVSIRTDAEAGLVMDNGEHASGSYQLQSGYAAAKSANPWTRYYYNLDTVTNSDKNELSLPQQKLMSWGLNQYAHKSIKSNFADPFDGRIADGNYLMGGYSWYPVDIRSNVTVKGTFEFRNKEFEGSEGEYAFKRTSLELGVAPYTTQHYMLHEGLFRNVSGCTLTVGANNENVTFRGNIGALNSSDGTGVLVFGEIAGSQNATAKIDSSAGGIVLDGIYVHNFQTKAATYAPLLINKADSYTDLIIHNVSTGNWYKNNLESAEFPYAGTSLIGVVGSGSAQNINIEFNGIQLDGRDGSKGTTHTALDLVYPTSHSIFNRATLLESFSYNVGSDGVYDFNLEEDWSVTEDDPETPDVDESSYSHTPGKVTYGSELSDSSSTGRNQYFGEEFWYKNTKGGIYTNYGTPLTNGNGKNAEDMFVAPVDFSNFLPYVATASTAANVKTEKNYQIRVNHSISVELEGCGTYNDPYQIRNGNQLKVMADIMAGGSPGGDTIIILPNVTEGNDTLSENTLVKTTWDQYGHSQFRYDSENKVYQLLDSNGNPVSKKSYTASCVREYLAGAYYKIQADITLAGGVNGFKGLGYVTGTTDDDKASVFRGVIVGNGQRTITNNSEYPLIYSSYGSVVKDINIVVNSAITREQTAMSRHSEDAAACQTYGAVIGQILGGDNIIEKVAVTYNAGTTITLSGDYAYLIPVGGYVGVVVNGALIFRDMGGYYNATYSAATRIRGIAPDSTIVQYGSGDDLETDLVAESNTKWLYVNPIIGRVLNGYAVTESGVYRPFETGTRTYSAGEPKSKNGAVTMRNGTKNYSIADINQDDTNKISVSDYSKIGTSSFYKTTVTIPNDQTLFLLAALVQSKTTVSAPTSGTQITAGASYGAHKTTHTAAYNQVGDDGSGAKPAENSGHDYLKAQNDSYAASANTVPYIVDKYAVKGVFGVSHKNTVCDMVLSKNGDNPQTFYLPDGFKGLGSYLVSDNYISLHQLNGNGNTVSLNMKLEYYKGAFDASTHIDNYYPASNDAGFGFFNYLRQNREGTGTFNDTTLKTVNYQVHDLIISGKVSAQVYKANGSILGYGYDTDNKDNNYNIVSVGGLTGAAGNRAKDIICVADVELNNLEVFGPKTAGGLIGYMQCNGKTAYLYDCSADTLTVSAGQEAGGLLGAAGSTVLQINGDVNGTKTSSEIKIKAVNIVSTLTGGSKGGDYDRNQNRGFYAGGIVGRSVSAATIQNMTVGQLTAEYFGFIGNSDRTNDTLTEQSSVGTVYDGTGGGSIIRCPKKPWSIVGGVIGAVSGNNGLKVVNCNVYNISMYGGFVSGISGRPEGTSTIYNCNIDSTQSDTDMARKDGKSPYMIAAWYGAAGLLGEPRNTCTIEGCNVRNYVIRCYSEGNGGALAHAGGITGRSYTNGTTIRNCSVSKCYIEGRKAKDVDMQEGIGGVIGINEKGVTGYNILIDDVKLLANSDTVKLENSFEYKTINSENGNIVPFGYMGGACDSSVSVKITGFSLQVSDDNDAVTDPWYYGNNKDSNRMGPASTFNANSYFINADYNGACVYTEDDGETYTMRSKVFSNIKDNTNNVPDNTVSNTTIITDNSPYVTTSPKVMIDAENFLTGDAMASLTFKDSIAKKIVDDAMKDESDRPAQYYQNIRLSFPGAFAGTAAKNTPYSFDEKPSETQVATMKALYPELYRDSDGNNLEEANYPTYADIYLTELKAKFSTYQTGMRGKTGIPEEYDFPVLVVDDSNPSNTTELINNYLRILTNTDYDFAAGTFSNGDTASAVFTVALAKCTYDKEKGKFTADYKSGAACLKNQGGYFKIDGEYDNTNSDGQFTLIDVKFLDPTGTNKVAYHLYVPVLVKKVMKYDFEVSLLSGTNYRLQPYKIAPRGNSLIENLGNPITLEARWVYRWTCDEWTAEIKNGENLLRTYNKKLLIENNNNAGFPENTRMVLVDANGGNRAYYADIADEGVYTSGMDNYLNLNQFKSADDETAFKSIKLNDFFNVSVVTGGTGFVQVTAANDDAAVIAGAKVRANVGDESGNYYRPYNADTDAELTQVGLNFAFKEGMYETYGTGEDAYSYLVEDYYISFYTEAENDSIYHIVFTSPITFGDNNNPSDVNLRGDAHLFVGDIYENSFWIEGDTRADVEVSVENSKIGATFNADIRLTDNAGPIIHSYLDYNSVNIFQSFLIYLNRQEESGNSRGIKTVPVVDVSRYTVGGTDVKNAYEENAASTNSGTITNNYIELRNNTNLKSYLLAAYKQGGGATFRITATFTLDYVGDRETDTENRIIQQFPTRDISNRENHSIGTKIGGSSNISSSLSTAAYSKMVSENWDDTMYFTAANATASLIYSSNDATNINGEYDQLGINARELTETEIINGYANIKTLAAYDVIQLSQADNAGSMKITATLRRKDDYDTAIKIPDYIKADSFVLKNADGESIAKDSVSTDKAYVYIINKPMEVLDFDPDSKIYEIPIDFAVYTGVNENFENKTSIEDGAFYSNYMVKLELELYTGKDGKGEAITGSYAGDHVIYTNAKVMTEIVPQSE